MQPFGCFYAGTGWMSEDPITAVRWKLEDHEDKYRRYARNWKVGYRGLLVAAAFFSSSAAVVGQLEIWKLAAADDLASILAAVTAVITTLIAALDFEANWQMNRKAKIAVSAIVLESHKSTANADALLSDLQKVVQRRGEVEG